MAKKNTVELEPFKKGDTPTFRFDFTNPYEGFNWSIVNLDCAMTNVQAPLDNSGAAAVRTGQILHTTSTGAYYDFTLSITESKRLQGGGDYNIEAQLNQDGVFVATPVTAKVKVLQDYVI